jgi:asparagine synthase (glutamine-hydrolysing)
MCGIAGIVSAEHQAKELQRIVIRMRDCLAHRGPDDVGLYVEDGITLAHTRLSIIDLSGGQQPLTSEDGAIRLVVNGEIYNYKSLQKRLLSRGHRLLTQSDSEVIIHLYEDEGEKCLEYLDGMFAFALWDGRQRKLLLARDRFGMKPLYFAAGKNTVCFASELTAIIRARLFKAEVDPFALYGYLTLSYVPGPWSIFKGIQKVQPAERIIVRNGSVERKTYWTPQEVTVPRKRSMAVEALAEQLKESVCTHLVADVPVAAFLSGGVDSSSVVAMAQRHTRMETLCVSFPQTEIDEAPIARQVANHLGTNHHEVNIITDPTTLLYEAVEFLDEPFADSSALPTFAVCRAARNIAKVVLSGDGGDEVFGGYTGRYRIPALKTTIPLPGMLARGLRKLPPWRIGRRRSLPEMLELATLPDEELYIVDRQITSAADRAKLFGDSEAFEYELTLKEFSKKLAAKFVDKHPVHRAMWMDLMSSLPDDMLTKVDRMSMAHGLEVRVPLLDHRLVEFVLSLPPSWLVSPWPVEGKLILRQMVAPLLGESFIKRPKQGFIVPLNSWLSSYFLKIFDEICLGREAYISDFIDRKTTIELRQRPLDDRPRKDLYALLILELWFRKIYKEGG